jgi:outer membrane protein insertion porin family
MKSVRPRWLRVCAVLLACMQYAAVAQVADRPAAPAIEKIVIKHIGPPAVSDELIRANIRIKEGDSYSQVSVDDDVRNLYSTGYFYNVRVGQETSAKGLTITYAVQGKPVLTEIRFTGNLKYSVSKLRKKVSSKPGEPLDERKLFNDSQEILKMYQKAGLQKTKVEPRPSINENLGKGTVTFEITEAPKVRIDNVIFDHATHFKQSKLRRTIKTRRWWMWSWLTGSGRLKDEEFEEDKEKLREFYGENGYIDFELKDVRFEYPRTNHMVLHLDVSEGTQYKVGAVEFKGNELYKREEIIANLRSKDGTKNYRGLQLKPGATFTPKRLEKDLEAVEDFYGSQGYLVGNENNETHVAPQKIANIEKGTLDLQYNIHEGDKFYVERIDIKGNTKTKDKVIRRELAITPGEPFDMVRVKISKQRLEQMQYFEKVDTKPEDTTIDNRKNLVIGVEEKNTGNIAVGAGFSSVDSIVGFVEVTQGNFDLFNPPYFTGGGQKARIRVQYGSQRQDYIMGFTEPWFLGRRLRLDTEVYYRQLNYLSDNYTQTQAGGSVGLTKQLPFNLNGGVKYTLEEIGIKFSDAYKAQYPQYVTNITYATNTIPGGGQIITSNGVPALGPQPQLLQESGDRLVSRLDFTLAHDTRNSGQLPTRGHRIELAPELVGGPLGGDVSFYKLEFRVAQYWTPQRLAPPSSVWQDILENHVLELTGRIGVVSPFGDGDRGQKDRVPLFDRYYLGGLYSLRGYKFRKIGPVDELTGEPIGGDTSWTATIEYSVPIIERLRFAVFYDAGMVYKDPFSFNPTKYSDGSTTGVYADDFGFGIRLNLPIGPLRLDYGIPRTHDKYSGNGGKFQFGVGYTRDF